MKLIEFSEVNYKLLIIIIFPISKTIEHFVKKLYLKEENLLFMQFRYYISYIFSFIFLLIIKQKNKPSTIIPLSLNAESENNIRHLSKTSQITNEISQLKKNMDKKRKIKSIIFLIVLSIINLLCYVYKYIFEEEEYEFTKQSIGVFYDIIFFTLLSFFILKQKLYKHHFVSLILISFLLLSLFAISIIYNDKNVIIHSTLYYIGFSFGFSLFDVLGKKYFNECFNTPFFMLTIIGTINAIALLIYDIFVYFFKRDISGVIIGFQENINNIADVFAFILDLILDFIWNIGIWLTIYYFTPCHFFISEYFSEYINYSMNSINSKEDFYSISNVIIFSIAYFIIICCCLVFNEVIILNFCSLDYNTKKRIKERMQIDECAPTDESLAPSFDNDSE